MTTPRMYFVAAALSALALGVAVTNGWGQDYPDGDSSGAGVTVEANVQHADTTPATPQTDGDIVWQ